jgi:predicted ArsR family transcriptional regulator
MVGVSEAASRVARALLHGGPTTAADAAAGLGLSEQAVRKHLDQLVADGFVASADRPPYGPAPQRTGRGRRPRVFFLTDAGRDVFDKAYDDLAVQAMRFLAEHGGSEQVEAFAQQRAAQLQERYAGADLDDLAGRMSADGYAATTAPGPTGHAQLCQHHCPVGHVAQEFPQLCEAETEAIGRILGRHVIRLATIAHGDGVCTTVVAPANPAAPVPAPTSSDPIRKAAR